MRMISLFRDVPQWQTKKRQQDSKVMRSIRNHILTVYAFICIFSTSVPSMYAHIILLFTHFTNTHQATSIIFYFTQHCVPG